MPNSKRERIDGMGALPIQEVMTPTPAQLPTSATVGEAAQLMRDRDVGAVLVVDEAGLCGLITDRDIVVRAVAISKDPCRVKLADICSRKVWSLSPSVPVGQAAELMREKAIRRLPVIDDQARPVGVVSLGDLAICLDRSSVLGEISAAQPNH
jgi:CBS domain-containing protein